MPGSGDRHDDVFFVCVLSTLRQNEGFSVGDLGLETETYDRCKFTGETDLTIDEQAGFSVACCCGGGEITVCHLGAALDLLLT